MLLLSKNAMGFFYALEFILIGSIHLKLATCANNKIPQLLINFDSKLTGQFFNWLVGHVSMSCDCLCNWCKFQTICLPCPVIKKYIYIISTLGTSVTISSLQMTRG